jgi:arginine utilization regulatory protein
MNIRGDRITTINTTIPLYVKGNFAGALEMARDITRIRNHGRKGCRFAAAALAV